MRRLIATTLIAASLAAGGLFASAAAAAIPVLTEAQGRAALVRHLDSQYAVQNPTISCNRVSRVRLRCHFDGLTPSDLIEGNTRSWSGYATVTRTATRITVLVTPLYWDGGLPPLPA
jgi:hypothetical protein